MKKILRITCFFFAVLMLFLACPFSASAEVVENPMLSTYVCDDLKTMLYDLNDYPKDESADFVSVINFTEYGYDYNKDQRYYGLYIYLYNPSGKPLRGTNYVELSYKDKNCKETAVAKYPLQIMSVSKDGINDNVFYKLSILDAQKIAYDILDFSREYSISALELRLSEDIGAKAETFPVKGKYTFTGFQENFGGTGSGKLFCNYEEIEVVDVELHPASWFTKTSDLGEDYRYEVSSVYFNIPDYYIEKYGDINDETSGLYSVQGEYRKGVVNGLVVDPDYYDLYKQYAKYSLSLDPNYQNGSVGEGWGFYNSYDRIGISNNYYKTTYDLTFNISSGTHTYGAAVDPSRDWFVSNNKVSMLIYVLQSITPYEYVTSQDFYKAFISSGGTVYKSSSFLTALKDYNFGTLSEKTSYNISVDDESLNSAIHSYAEKVNYGPKDNSLEKLLKRLYYGDLLDDAEGYAEIKPIVEISNKDLSSVTLNDGALAEKLFVGVDDLSNIRKFYNANDNGNHVYLMRFDVNPFYAPTVHLTGTKGWLEPLEDFDALYFEKVVFADFDILSFTFRDSGSNFVTVPVSCTPVDNVGSIVPGNNNVNENPNNPSEPNRNNFYELLSGELGEWLSSLKTWLKVVIIVIACVLLSLLVFLIIKFGASLLSVIGKGIVALGRWFRRLFSAVGRGIGKAAKWGYNNVDKFADKVVAAKELKDSAKSVRKEKKQKKEAQKQEKSPESSQKEKKQ